MNFLRKLFKRQTDSEKADTHAILALSYWRKVKRGNPDELDRVFATVDDIYVRLGKEIPKE